MKFVVSAAIVDRSHRRILLIQRDPETSYPFMWCTPGGKVELGETFRDTCARELEEELDVTLVGELGSLLYDREVSSTRTCEAVRVLCFVVFAEQLRGKPSPRDGTIGIDWCNVAEVRGKRLTPADSAALDKIVSLLESFEVPS